MKFKKLVIISFTIVILFFIVFIPSIFSHLKNTPQINYYINHPDLTYKTFSQCKLRVDDVNECYSAYSAAVSLADSDDCSLTGIASKRRFKKLVEDSKEKVIDDEIVNDCIPNNNKTLIGEKN
ncbi:hypothetical protein [Rahnella sp. PCH160]|uniref:hypothetical protein n=1 Tax=Rahnella sp. PCH160 TaxID=3447928 RepID=UPI0039FCF15F